jgi:hypothetical protein
MLGKTNCEERQVACHQQSHCRVYTPDFCGEQHALVISGLQGWRPWH